MKKNLIKTLAVISVVITLIAVHTNAKAGDAPFVKGSKTIGFFAGPGNDYGYHRGFGYDGNYISLPTLGVIYDQGFFENVGPGTIGIGGVVAFNSSYYNYYSNYKGNQYKYKDSYSNVIIGLRGTYHLNLLADKAPKFDPYAGITVGVRLLHYRNNDPDPDYYNYNPVYPVAGAFVGAKYNVAKNFGFFAEVGYDFGFARIGFNINF